MILGLLYARFTPAWQTPDEPAHYNFIRHVANNYALPVLEQGCYNQAYLTELTTQKFPSHLPIDSICYEHYQPPLYYLLATPLFILTKGNLLALRLLSVCFGGMMLVMVYKTIYLLEQKRSLAKFTNFANFMALATTAFVAFVPMHLTMLSAVNNDSFASLLFITFIYLLLRWFVDDSNSAIPLIIGIVLGLILLTKVTIYISVVLLACVFILKRRLNLIRLSLLFKLYVVALLIALPFYLRNATIYGNLDILGLQRHDEVVIGQLRTITKIEDMGFVPYIVELTRTTFHSFWGQFGWMAVPMDYRVYFALIILNAIAIYGLVQWLRNSLPLVKKQRQVMTIMGSIFILVMGIFIGLNMSFVQFQGRYFFTALMPIGLFFNTGLLEAFRREHARQIAFLILIGMGWLGITSYQTQILNKWGLAISGGAMLTFLIRYWLPIESPHGFVISIYVALAGLSGVCMWWFILPNL